MQGLSRGRKTLLEAAGLPGYVLLAGGAGSLLVDSEQPLFAAPSLAGMIWLLLHSAAVLFLLAPERRRFWLPGHRSLRPLAFLIGLVGLGLIAAGEDTLRPGLFVLYGSWTFLGGSEGVLAVFALREHRAPVGAVGATGALCGLTGTGLLVFLPYESGKLGAALLLAAVLLLGAGAAVGVAEQHVEGQGHSHQPQALAAPSIDSELDI